jgi:predicted nucleotidyltransferase
MMGDTMKGIESYKVAWQKRFKEDEERLKRKAEQAKKTVIEMSRVLVEKFGAKRVWLFGSLIEGFFWKGSDIDLAVEGLSSEVYFAALSEIWGLLPSAMELDLIPLEDAYESLRERILKKGELLYEE